MWRYASGASICGAKVLLVQKLIVMLNEYVVFHGVLCKPPKLILGGFIFYGQQNIKINPTWIRLSSTKHHKTSSGAKYNK